MNKLQQAIKKRQKILLHVDVETVGGFDHAARTIWACAHILTDAKGNELSRKAYLIQEAMPFLAGDTFWSQRKNGMMCKVLKDYETVTAAQFHEIFQTDLDIVEKSGGHWVAFNSRFERGAFVNFAVAFRLPAFNMPFELDLALYAFDVLPLSKYAAYALENNLYTESKKSFSSKCEHLLTWLVACGKMPETAEHSHLALDDTISQVALFKACKATNKKRPDFGRTLTHFAHPMWRKWLKIKPDADKTDGRRYANA